MTNTQLKKALSAGAKTQKDLKAFDTRDDLSWLDKDFVYVKVTNHTNKGTA